MTYDARMSGLEQMRPFFRVCQCVGLFPFRMELKDNARVSSFTFSWKYPITWWFIILFGIQITPVFTIWNAAGFNLTGYDLLPTILFISVSLTSGIFVITMMTARFWITVRLSSLCGAIKQMEKIEENLFKMTLNNGTKCTVKQRAILGAVSISVWVKLLLYLIISFRFLLCKAI